MHTMNLQQRIQEAERDGHAVNADSSVNYSSQSYKKRGNEVYRMATKMTCDATGYMRHRFQGPGELSVDAKHNEELLPIELAYMSSHTNLNQADLDECITSLIFRPITSNVRKTQVPETEFIPVQMGVLETRRGRLKMDV